MYGVGNARRALAKPREGRVSADLVSCDQDDPGAHSCQYYRGDLADSGRAASDNNSLATYLALVSRMFNIGRGWSIALKPCRIKAELPARRSICPLALPYDFCSLGRA